jgi:hypothetical protein
MPLPLSCTTHVLAKGGGTVTALTSMADKKIKDLSAILQPGDSIAVVLAAGICDMTEKVRHPGGVQLLYDHSKNRPEKILSDLHGFQSHFMSQNIPVKIACIPSASLSKNEMCQKLKGNLVFSSCLPEEICVQQRYLEEDLGAVNGDIIAMNSAVGMRSVRWDRDLIRSSIKRRKNTTKKIIKIKYQHLYDGVHPDQYLSDKWFGYLCWSVIQDVCEHTSPDTESSDSDTENDRTWDFKRQKCL